MVNKARAKKRAKVAPTPRRTGADESHEDANALKNAIYQVFEEVSQSASAARSAAGTLDKHRNHDDFPRFYLSAIGVFLEHSHQSKPYKTRITRFIAESIAAHAAVETIESLVRRFARAPGKHVRENTMGLLVELARRQGENRETILPTLISAFQAGLDDTIPNVRKIALEGIDHCHLSFDGSERELYDEDELLASLASVVRWDPNQQVRANALKLLPFREDYKEYVVCRHNDTQAIVRSGLWEGCLTKIGFNDIPMGSVRALLISGLQDDDHDTKVKASRCIFGHWFSDLDVIGILDKVGVMEDLLLSEAILEGYLEYCKDEIQVKFTDYALETLSPSQALCLRVSVEKRSVNSTNSDLPDLLDYGESLKRYFEECARATDKDDQSRWGTVLEQWLALGKALLALQADAVGMDILVQLLKDLLVTEGIAIPGAIVESMVALMSTALKSHSESICQMLQDLLYSKSIQEGETEEDDRSILLTKVRLCAAFLKWVKHTPATEEFYQQVLENAIKPGMYSKSASTIYPSMVALARYGCYDAQVAEQSIPVLLDFLGRARGLLKSTALAALTDLLLVHSFNIFQHPEDTEARGNISQALDRELKRIIQEVEDLEALEPWDIRTTTLSCIKLLATDTMADGRILRSLMDVYFCPSIHTMRNVYEPLHYFFQGHGLLHPDDISGECMLAESFCRATEKFELGHVLDTLRQLVGVIAPTRYPKQDLKRHQYHIRVMRDLVRAMETNPKVPRVVVLDAASRLELPSVDGIQDSTDDSLRDMIASLEEIHDLVETAGEEYGWIKESVRLRTMLAASLGVLRNNLKGSDSGNRIGSGAHRMDSDTFDPGETTTSATSAVTTESTSASECSGGEVREAGD